MRRWDAARARARQVAPLLAPSVMCADWLRMGAEVRMMERGGADLLHFDVVDGHFAPNFIVGLDLIRALRSVTELPFEVHMMGREPDGVLEQFAAAGVQLVIVHPEACSDPAATILKIRELGMRAGLALSPEIPADAAASHRHLIDLVLVMTIVPGVGGQSLIPEMIPKIGAVHRALAEDATRVLIEVDGQVSRTVAPGMVRQGARVLVCGTSSIFGRAGGTRAELQGFRADLVQALGNSWPSPAEDGAGRPT